MRLALFAVFASLCFWSSLAAGELAGAASPVAHWERMEAECQELETQALAAYDKIKDKDVNEPPFVAMGSDLRFYYKETEFIRSARHDPVAWIMGMEKHLAQRIKQKSLPTSLLWGAYIDVTLRDHPEAGRKAIRDFISRQQLPPAACIDFLGSLCPVANDFMANKVIRESDVIAMLQRTLNDQSPSYGYKWQLFGEEEWYDADNEVVHPCKPGETIKAKMRTCDWGCMLTFAWFSPRKRQVFRLRIRRGRQCPARPNHRPSAEILGGKGKRFCDRRGVVARTVGAMIRRPPLPRGQSCKFC